MKHFVLVHGAWGGAWEFAELASLLAADGSQVTAVDLPGHGNNKAPIADVTMAAYVRKVTEVVESVDAQAILVGHSLAGSIISQVAEDIPEKISRLIFVAASLPRSGDTVLGLMESDEGGQLLPNILFSEDQRFNPAVQTFVAGPDWAEFTYPLSSFSGVDVSAVWRVVFSGGPDTGEFAFQIDEVRFR